MTVRDVKLYTVNGGGGLFHGSFGAIQNVKTIRQEGTSGPRWKLAGKGLF